MSYRKEETIILERFYKKSELGFSITWIIIYTLTMGVMRNNFGDESIYSALAISIIAVIITVFIVKNKLEHKYGFKKVRNSGKYLYFIPFILICTVNLRSGISMNYDFMHLVFAVLTLGLAGYVEEVIFRGFLFKSLEKDNVKQAVIISALTFGIGHILNLFTGEESLDTFLQIGYAIAIGLAFVMVFYKSGSLIPCIITHSIINMTSKFADQNSIFYQNGTWQIIIPLFLMIVAGSYAIYLYRNVNKE